jgi:hypothetical protein
MENLHTPEQSDCVPHGRMTCDRCWKGVTTSTQHVGRFLLVHDPGHSGSSNPSVLVLGISKGNTQSAAIAKDDFDKVAFKNSRDRLLTILQVVGLLPNESEAEFNNRFRAGEREYGFASVVRCSVSGMDRKTSSYKADSPNVVPALKPGSEAYKFAYACVDQHIRRLPPATHTVILLGTTDAYIKHVKDLIGRTRGRVTPVNDVAYRSDGVLFVHVAHPSRGNGHFSAFISGKGSPGEKMRLAEAALRLPR